MSIEKNPINANFTVKGIDYMTYDKEIGLRRFALGEIMRKRGSMSEEEMQKIQNYFIKNLPQNSLNHFNISEFVKPKLKKNIWWYPISVEVRSKIKNGIQEIQEKNGAVVVVNNETLKARILTKRIGGLPQDLLQRIIDRTNSRVVKTITPEDFKKIDQFFRTYLPNNPNLLEESDIVRVNRLGTKLDANNCTKSITNELKKNKQIMYLITDIVIKKIKGCINAFDNTENVDITAIDHTKKRTEFEMIDNSEKYTADNSKEHTNQPQNEGFPEQIVVHLSKKTKTINNQHFAPQDILAFENPFLNRQCLPMSFLPIGTIQTNNIETEYGRPFPNPQPIVSDPSASEDPAPSFLLNVIQPPLNQSQQQNEQIDLFGDDPFLLEKEQKLPDSDTHEQFNEPFNFTLDDELEELFLPKASVQTASTNSQASSAQLLLDDLLLHSSLDDDAFPLETTWDA